MPTTHLLARAVIRDDAHVLVVRADGQSHTFLPGGHREQGEGLTTCLRRELQEELGVEAQIDRYLGGVEHSWERDGKRQYEINHCFSVSVASLSADRAPRSREDYLSFGWVSVSRLEAVSLQPAPLRSVLSEGTAPPWWASTVDEEANSLRRHR